AWDAALCPPDHAHRPLSRAVCRPGQPGPANHVIIPFTNLGSEAALRLDVPTRRAVIADEARTCALDVDQTADATGPRILADLTGSAPLVARQNASGKSAPHGSHGLCGSANRSGSETRRGPRCQKAPATARHRPTATPGSSASPLRHRNDNYGA